MQIVPGRVRHVSELLPGSPVRRGARLHVPASVISYPVPHPEPPVRLSVRLDHAQAEVRLEWGRHRRCDGRCGRREWRWCQFFQHGRCSGGRWHVRLGGRLTDRPHRPGRR
uniref:Uncharacterized protein n=1 Tax=Cacopsylla melanoneura TaxID=428564 RepID=A0A8D9BHK8_9HEMI